MRQCCLGVTHLVRMKLRSLQGVPSLPNRVFVSTLCRREKIRRFSTTTINQHTGIDRHRPKFALNNSGVDASLDCGRYVDSTTREHENLQVHWSDGNINKYPLVWLRDNCTCDKCYNSPSSSRLMSMGNLDLNVKAKSIKVEDKNIVITWSDGHTSVYDSRWLNARSFSEVDIESRLAQFNPRKPHVWGSELQDKLPTFNFEELLSDDIAIYNWINALESIGFAIVKDTPRKTGEVTRLGEKVGFLRESHYGKNFQVLAKVDPSNLAYTTAGLGLHTDLPYYYYTPGVQMLHCINQVSTKGGDNQFADGFHAALKLKERHPDLYDVLTTTLVDFRDIGVDMIPFYTVTRQPVIRLDRDGFPDKITFNNMTRDSYLHVPLEHVPTLYKAMKVYYDIMYEPENHIRYKLEPGDIASFGNYRVLHGRTEYKVLETGERQLDGGYFDWDELISKRRVIMLEQGLLGKEISSS